MNRIVNLIYKKPSRIRIRGRAHYMNKELVNIIPAGARIASRRFSKIGGRQQRRFAKEVKIARELGLLKYWD